MRCPFCRDLENRVVDSRLGKDGDAIRRRRHCERCGRRFTTYERIEESLPVVVKKDGRREPFDRSKIVRGLARACEKRPVLADTIEALADGIERRLQESGEREVTSRAIDVSPIWRVDSGLTFSYSAASVPLTPIEQRNNTGMCTPTVNTSKRSNKITFRYNLIKICFDNRTTDRGIGSSSDNFMSFFQKFSSTVVIPILKLALERFQFYSM